MWCELNFQWSSHLKIKENEACNLNDKESLPKTYNDKNEKLLESLQGSNDVVSGGRKWFAELKDCILKFFTKVWFT